MLRRLAIVSGFSGGQPQGAAWFYRLCNTCRAVRHVSKRWAPVQQGRARPCCRPARGAGRR
eukprot:2299432-Rhodomonas_salina.1